MRVTFLKPNDCMITEENGRCSAELRDRVPPYSLTVVATAIKKLGHEVSFIDAMAEGLSHQSVAKRLSVLKPEVIVFSGNGLAIQLSVAGLENVKEENGTILVCLTNMEFEGAILEGFDLVDVVIRREWMATVLDFLPYAFERQAWGEVKGIIFRKDDRVVHTARQPHLHIEDRPLPDLTMLPMQRYSMYSMLTTEGCNYRCAFCRYNYIAETAWEHKSVERLIAEIKAFQQFGNKFFRFEGHELTLDVEFAKSFFQRVIDERLKLIFEANTRASITDPELYALMARAGCISTGYGAESGVQRILDLNNKKLKIEQTIETQRLLTKNRIPSKAYFLVGQLGETEETIRQTVRFILDELKPEDCSFDIVVPYPETAMYQVLRQNNWIESLTRDNVVWIHTHIYNWDFLRSEGVRPSWRVGDLDFERLVELWQQHDHLLPHGNYRAKLANWALRGPAFWKEAFRQFAANPRTNLYRMRSAILGR